MKKFITTEQAEIGNFQGQTKQTKCDCGDSYAIITNDEELIVCDACYENASFKEKFVQKLTKSGVSKDFLEKHFFVVKLG